MLNNFMFVKGIHRAGVKTRLARSAIDVRDSERVSNIARHKLPAPSF